MTPSSTPMSDEQEDELTLTRDLDTIQAFIWARIKDEADARELTLSIGDCYALGSVIKEELHPRVRQLLAHHTKEAVEAARIDENRLSQRCFDGMAGAPGDQFSKHFARLIERGFELAAPQQSTSPDGEKKDGDE